MDSPAALAEDTSRPEQPRLQAHLADAKPPRRRLRTQFLDLPHDEHSPVVLGKRLQRMPQDAAKFRIQRQLLRTARAGMKLNTGGARDQHGVQGPESFLSARSCESVVHHDASEPCGKAGSPFELVEVRERMKMPLLNDILRLQFAVKNPAQCAAKVLAIALREDIVQASVARANATYYFFVRERG